MSVSSFHPESGHTSLDPEVQAHIDKYGNIINTMIGYGLDAFEIDTKDPKSLTAAKAILSGLALIRTQITARKSQVALRTECQTFVETLRELGSDTGSMGDLKSLRSQADKMVSQLSKARADSRTLSRSCALMQHDEQPQLPPGETVSDGMQRRMDDMWEEDCQGLLLFQFDLRGQYLALEKELLKWGLDHPVNAE